MLIAGPWHEGRLVGRFNIAYAVYTKELPMLVLT